MASLVAVQHESWDALECDSGTRQSVISDVIEGTRKRTRAVDISRAGYTFGLPLDSPSLATVIEESVIRLPYAEVDENGIVTTPDVLIEEWRVREIDEDIDKAGETFARVTCDHPGMDLLHRSEIMERVDGGISFVDFEYDGPPSEHLDILFGVLGGPYVVGKAPSYFASGTVSITTPIVVRYNRMRPHEAIVELLNRLRAVAVTAEWTVRRNGATNYLVDIVPQVNASAAIPRVEGGRSMVSFGRGRDSVEQATVIVPAGGNHPAAGTDDFRLGIGENHFRVTAVASDDLTLSHDVVIEDDQWNGFFVEEPDGTFTQITDSTAPNILTVTGHAVTVDELVSIRRNAAGDELSGVRWPSRVTLYGPKARALDRGDIPYVNNWVPNPWFRDWTDGGKGASFFLPPPPPVLIPGPTPPPIPRNLPRLVGRGGCANGICMVPPGGHLGDDDFDRADAPTLGFTWFDVSKSGSPISNILKNWEIASNKAQVKSGEFGNASSLVIGAATEYVIRADVAAGGGQVFLSRWIDSGNYILAGIGTTAGNQRLKIITAVNGSQTEQASVDISPDDTSTGEHTLKAWFRDGTIDVWYDFGTGGAVSASAAFTGLDGVLGVPGIFGDDDGGNRPTVDDWHVAAGNIITCSGLATGEQMDIDGNETVESGGTATWNLGGVDFPLSTIQIEASGGSPVTAGPFSPTGGIYPGTDFVKQ